MNNRIHWQWYEFSALSVYDLYAVLQLRQKIFVVEQQSIYQDLDNKDLAAKHLIGYIDNKVITALRFLPLDVHEKGYMSFGRVVVDSHYRGQGIAHLLLQQFFSYIQINQINAPIRISSQAYLQQFYEKYHFTAVGEQYLEDGIPHIAMVNKIIHEF